MGNNVPRQTEGKVGDITVREISGAGLRCYIKTNSGWYDINSMEAADRVDWTPMILGGNWAHNTTYVKPAYFKDSLGFVHMRGGITNGAGGATDDITTLPAGFRPPKLSIVAAVSATGQCSLKITAGGVVNYSNGGNTSLSFLDGVSFYASQQLAASTGGGGGAAGSGQDR